MSESALNLDIGTTDEHVAALYSITIYTLFLAIENTDDPLESLDRVSKKIMETLHNKERGHPVSPEFLMMIENIFSSMKADLG
ncbi:MAG: hypothetical protein V3U84_02100 [Thiotrichaceae bacterium]